jgi:hypothetical protein
MKVSRRKFLAATPLAIGAVLPFRGFAFGKTASLLDVTTIDDDPLARLTWDSFVPYVTTNFRFTDADGNAVDLQLARMDDTRPRGYVPRGTGDECFALTFSGPLRRTLVQDVYSVEHFALGSFSLLITVLGSRNRRNYYEAVINRIVG